MFIEFLVNNAGFGCHGEFTEADWQKQYEMINLNITALTQLTWLYLKDMKEQNTGRILNVASAAAFGPGPYMSVYYATKAYVKSFSEALYEEMKEYGITVTALNLGPAATGFWDAAGFDEGDLEKRLKAASPASVARSGYRAMMQGKAVCNHGLTTKALNLGSRLAPDAVVRKAVKKANR
ncbi:MAG: SDR family NAD(P)-dependent oxidoreductase [Lachnospiraceae bacterium]|nr:SDR family NAD(P)-dependent oxidoreductase [Lachnospiraceae bacterium]